MIEHLIVFKKECSQGHFFFLYSISTKFGYIINFSKQKVNATVILVDSSTTFKYIFFFIISTHLQSK